MPADTYAKNLRPRRDVTRWCRRQRSRAERSRLDFVGSPAAPKYADCTSFHKCHDDLHSPSQHLSRCLAQLASDGEERQKPDGMLKFAKEIGGRYFKKHSVPVEQTGEICHSGATPVIMT